MLGVTGVLKWDLPSCGRPAAGHVRVGAVLVGVGRETDGKGTNNHVLGDKAES